MGLISFDPLEDGTPATANKFNQLFAKIIDTINGKLSSENLASDAVTAAKIASGAVTNEKLALTSAFANSGNAIRFGNFLLQWGVTSVANAGTTITFAQPFASAPTITVSIEDINPHIPWVVSKTATNAVLKQPYVAAPLTVSWIAVGAA